MRLYVQRQLTVYLGRARGERGLGVGGARDGSGVIYQKLRCRHQNDSASRGAAEWAVLILYWLQEAKSQDGVHKPQLLKRKENRVWLEHGPSAYQPSALPLGQTGSLAMCVGIFDFIGPWCLHSEQELSTVAHVLPYSDSLKVNMYTTWWSLT